MMAFDLEDETSGELFEEVRKIARKFSSGFENSLKGKLSEQILNIEKFIKYSTVKEVSVLVSQMPVFDLKQQLMQPIYNHQSTEEKDLNHTEQKVIEIAYTLIFAYLSEYKLRNNQLINSDEKALVDNYLAVGQWNISNFKYAKDKLTYSINHLVFMVIEDKYTKSALSKTDDKLENIETFLFTIKKWEESFDQKQKAVLDLEEKLDKSKQTYDFVLLNKGFKQLYDEKKIELTERRESFSKFGATLAITPLAVIGFSFFLFLWKDESAFKYLLYLAFPVTTFMLIILYFVRVSLQHVRSVQSQMMQLELRMALCQFIHNYAEDSETLHKKNAAGFEKFENIIFSPLVSSDDKIPTTFDGMEQLAKMVDIFRKN